jgi:aldose 1-epimerase
LIHLRRGNSKATLLPHLGGSIGGFWVGEKAVLRPAPAGATNPLDAASFPLVPYANRIAKGRFTFAGEDYTLPRNVAGFEHPLHGLGWIMPWIVEKHDADSALIACAHAADDHWPWDWSATQSFTIEEGALCVTLEVTNRSARPMPCGLGQHPYFVRDPGGALTFDASGVWLNDAGMIPKQKASANAFGRFAQGAVPDATVLTDNCWYGWDGTATWDGNVVLTSRGSRFLHVLARPGGDFICIEPTTQMPDAFNRDDFKAAGGSILASGASMCHEMTIQVHPA